MAKELVLDVVAKKNSRDLVLLAEEFDRLSKTVDDNGKSLQKNASFSQFLEQQISKTKTQVRQLGEEFKKTGSADVFASLKGAEKNLKSLEGISKQLAKSVETGVQEGSQQGIKFLGNAFASLPPEAQAGIAAGLGVAITSSATAIGAALNGVLLAGVGLGGVAAGVVGQLHDPAVEKAFGDLKTRASGVLADSTRSFAPVLIAGAQEFENALTKAEPKLEQAFDRLAPHAEAVFHGLEQFGEKAAPGFLEALDAAGPILDELARDLPRLGEAVSSFFHSLSQGAGGARDGLRSLLTIIGGVVQGTGYLIEGLSKGYEALAAFGDLLKGDVGDAAARFNDVFHGKGGKNLATDLAAAAAAARGAAPDFGALAKQLSATTETADTLAGAMTDKLLGSLLASDHATLSFDESLTNLSDSFAQNGKQLDIHTKAGQQNREAVLSVVEANLRIYDAQIQAGASAKDAAAAYDANTQSLRNQLRQAGLTKDQIDGLIGKYAQVPDKVNTDIALQGLTDSINNIGILIGAINGIPKYVKIEAAIEAVDASGLAQNVPNKHRAAGGPVMAGQAYIVGEKQPELFVPNVNGMIIPNLPPPTPFRTGSAAGSATRVLQPIQLVTPAGKVIWQTVLEYAADTGQIPANLWPSTSR